MPHDYKRVLRELAEEEALAASAARTAVQAPRGRSTRSAGRAPDGQARRLPADRAPRRSRSATRVERAHDYREFLLPRPVAELREQGARCMDCGVPFCHNGCPLGQPDPRLERPRLPRPLGRTRSRSCTRPTTSPSSPAACARRRARRRACSRSARATRSRSNRSRTRSSTAPGRRAGSRPQPPRRDRETGQAVAVVGSGPGGHGRRAAAAPRRATA